jgi:archaellum component FlaC
MSTGDWFTLRPLKTTNYQPQIDDTNNRVNNIEQQLSTVNQTLQNHTTRLQKLDSNVNFLIDTVAQVRQDIIVINLQLQQH